MLTKQMKKDLANPADVVEITTSNFAQIKAERIACGYDVQTCYLAKSARFSPRSWYFNATALRETAAVFNALAETLDKQNGVVNG